MTSGLQDFTQEQNNRKFLFTPGPASLLSQNLEGLAPCFSRGDHDYLEENEKVISYLKIISGQNQIVSLQGSASLALEIILLNFVAGRVLIVDTGIYSERLKKMLLNQSGNLSSVESIAWNRIEEIDKKYDWILCCFVETSVGLKVPIEKLVRLKQVTKAKLMMDATASIGLENGHEYADVLGFSSCKGLFGLTGASFIGYKEEPELKRFKSFYLDLATHSEKKVTGPYHSILSLSKVLPMHGEILKSVEINKSKFLEKFSGLVTFESKLQPLIATQINSKLVALDSRVVLYESRAKLAGSVSCHLGEAHLGSAAKGRILDFIEKA